MKKTLLALLFSLIALPGLVSAQTIGTLDQFTSTTSPSSAITQRTYGKTIKITGLTTGLCLTLDSSSFLTTTACGSSSSFPFTPTSWGVSTTTTLGLLNGFLSTASSTITSALRLSSLSIGGLAVGSDGLVYSAATTTAGTGITYSGNAFSINQAFTPTWTGAHIFDSITRSTTTAATSTSLFATTASSTNLFSAFGTLGQLLVTGSSTLQNFTGRNATTTNATTTALYVSGLASTTELRANTSTIGTLTVGSCTGCSSGAAASSTLLADNNSFSGTNTFANLTTFANLRATASSTIGGGTAATGLTVAGTASSTLFRSGNGAEAAPAYAFTGTDLGTGMFLVSGGTLGFSIAGTGHAALNSTNFYPYTNDVTALGLSGNGWSDLFLASGGVINWNAGNTTLTHTAGNLTLNNQFNAANFLATASSTFPSLTFTNATGTNATTTGSLTIPNSSTATVNQAGQIAIDTTSGQLKWNDGVRTQILTATTTKAFNIASTTLDALGKSFNTATSTFLLANYPEGMTMTAFYCTASTTGTALVRFGDPAGNYTEAATCTSGGLTPVSTNNTWTAFEGLTLQASSTAGAVSRITVTAIFNKTAD